MTNFLTSQKSQLNTPCTVYVLFVACKIQEQLIFLISCNWEMDLACQAYGPLHASNQLLLLYIAVTVACHNIGPAKKGGGGGGGGEGLL